MSVRQIPRSESQSAGVAERKGDLDFKKKEYRSSQTFQCKGLRLATLLGVGLLNPPDAMRR